MPSHDIATLADLESLYAEPSGASLAKEVDYLHPYYRAFVEASPFCLLSTASAKGGDCSPRGDAPGFVHVLDDRTLLLPDRRGNNRIDSLRNIADPRVGLLFLIPGVNETLRVSGTAKISTDPDLIARCVVQDKAPTSVLVIAIQSVFFQCARALMRSHLWSADAQISRETLPSNGTIVATLSQNAIDATTYDRELPDRLRNNLY